MVLPEQRLSSECSGLTRCKRAIDFWRMEMSERIEKVDGCLRKLLIACVVLAAFSFAGYVVGYDEAHARFQAQCFGPNEGAG